MTNTIPFFTKIRGILQNHTARESIRTLGTTLFYSGTVFVSNLLLARILGVTAYGTYSYALAWAIVLQLVTNFGLNPVIVRQVARYNTQQAWPLLRGILIWADKTVLRITAGLLIGTAGLIWLASFQADSKLVFTLTVMLFGVPLIVLARLRQAGLQGLEHVSLGQVPLLIIQPLTFVSLISLIYGLPTDMHSAPLAMSFYVISAGVALVCGTVLLNQRLPLASRKITPAYEIDPWIKSALPMLFINGMYIINNQVDMLMLGTMTGMGAAGIYDAADKGAQIISLSLFVLHLVLSPVVARLYMQGRMSELQQVATKSAWAVMLLALPLTLGFIFLGRWFLLLFGPAFVAGQTALIFLSLGQLVNAVTGVAITLLTMSKHEFMAAGAVGIGAVVNIILNVLLIPRLGIDGAALATMCSTIVLNVVLAWQVHRWLGINPTFFYRMFR